MQKYTAIITIIIVISYGVYNSTSHRKVATRPSSKLDNSNHHTAQHLTPHVSRGADLGLSDDATYRYIIDVINHGSSKLHFKNNEIMEGGYISEEDAPKVACYVMELSGKKCSQSYPLDAHLFFSSVCAGCHGEDGKGLHGAYPDLTRPTLRGMRR